MKNCYTTCKGMYLLACLLTAVIAGQSQNLIVNPGAEDGAPATTGWTAVSSGSNCFSGSGWRIPGNQNGYPAGSSGSYIFFSGCGGTSSGSTYELRQDVNVSSLSAVIDANLYAVNFRGFVQTFAQSPSDLVTLIAEYRDATNTTVLATYSSGAVSSPSVWTLISNSRVAPSGTRFIRIRLISTSFNGDSVDGYFDDITLTGVSLLPVTMLQFNAVQHNDEVALQWTTDMESNNNGFNILRSADGTHWEKIGFVPASKSVEGVKRYSYSDKNPLADANFYQVQQVDLDGHTTLSEIKRLRFSGFGSVYVYPNPVVNKIYIRSARNLLAVEVLNNQGQRISRQAGGNTVETSALKPGTYILKLLGKDFVAFRQFIKQ